MGSLFGEIDVLATLAAPTEAPPVGGGPGSGSLTMPWSLCGLPSIAVPLLSGPAGLPVVLQLVAAAGHDHALLAAAAWYMSGRR
jgi:Asp-tRNA(Asn)/Glu-tRNA(Gln) amidotransferase A subunit family amidase